MKRLLCIGLICAVAFCLSACGWIENEYTVITPHNAPPPTEPEIVEETTPAANTRSALRELIMSFVREGSARNEIDVTAYDGDLTAELPALFKRMEANSLYAYAVDYLDYDLVEREGSVYLELNMVLRRSAEEIAEIINVLGMDALVEQLTQALEGLTPGLTVRVSGFVPTDFNQLIHRYCLEHPDTIVDIPDVSVAVFPNSGGSRVVEFHFGYNASKTEIGNMRKNMDTMLTSVLSFTEQSTDDLSRYGLLCEYLVNRTRHDITGSHACAYNLLCKQEANNMGFASLVAFIAKQSGTECYLVQGTRNGVPYCWNIVRIGDEYRHLDMMQQWLDRNTTPELLTDAVMTGYEWNRSAFPECFDPNVPEEPEEEETVSADYDSDDQEPDESTEDTAAPDDEEDEPSEDSDEPTNREDDEP